MKKVFALILITFILISLCSCKGDVVERIPTATPTETQVEGTWIDYKNAKKFDSPIIFEDFKDKNGYEYYFSFYKDLYEIVEDNKSVIVKATKYKSKEAVEVICKMNLKGKIDWEYKLPKKASVKSVFVRDDVIYAFINKKGLHFICKFRFDGKLLDEVKVFDREILVEKDNHSVGDSIRAILGSDGIVILGEKTNINFEYILPNESFQIPSEREDFEFNHTVIKKIDFDGNEVWQRYYNGSLDVDYSKFLVNDDGIFCFKEKTYSYEKNYGDDPIYLPGEKGVSEEEKKRLEDDWWMNDGSLNEEEDKNEFVVVKISSDGYIEEEKRVESELYVREEVVCVDENGLLGTSGLDGYSDEKWNYFDIISYTLDGELIWQSKKAFYDGYDEDYSLEAYAISREKDFICVTLCGEYAYSEEVRTYITVYSLDGEFIDIFGQDGDYSFIGTVGERKVLFKRAEYDE